MLPSLLAAVPARSPAMVVALVLALVTLAASASASAGAGLSELVAEARRASGVSFIDLAVTRADGRCTLSRYSDPLPLLNAAGLSRLLTATLVVQLVEAGQLGLDDQLGRHLPEFEGSGITIEQLLMDRSGLRDRIRPAHRRSDAELARYVTDVARHRPAAAPGSRRSLAQVNYNLLGRVIEVVTGESFAVAMRTRLLSPLGMLDSTFVLDEVPEPSRVWGQVRRLGFVRDVAPTSDRAFAPASGLQTNAADLSRFVRAMLAAAEGMDEHVVSPQMLRALTAPRLQAIEAGVHIGFAWQVTTSDYGVRWHLDAGAAGIESMVTVYPQAGFGIILMGNREGWPRDELEHQLAELVATTDVCPRYPPVDSAQPLPSQQRD
jgi:CubicO group peptidase (beta-lactamase class C family)